MIVLVMLIMDVAKEVVFEEVVELVVAGEVELVVEAVVVVVAVVVVGEEVVVDVVVIEMVNNFKVVIVSIQEKFRACVYKTNIFLCNCLFLILFCMH